MLNIYILKKKKDHFVCLGSGDLMVEFCCLLEYANYYRNCKEIIDYISKNNRQIPLCIKSFFHIISEFLQIYRENLNWFLASKYYQTQSILELSYFMSQSFIILECIYKNIIQHFNQKIMENILETHELISHLYQLLLDIVCDQYSVKSSTIMSLFLGTISPYFDILDEWIFNGRLIDPFQEFFIKEKKKLNDRNNKNHIDHITESNNNEKQKKDIWNNYMLCKEKIPSFLYGNDIAEGILINGKSLIILRDLQRATNKDYKISYKPYSSSFEYFSNILSKYYPLEYCIQVINPKQKQTTTNSPKKMLILSPTKHKTQIKFASPKNGKTSKKSTLKSYDKSRLDPIQMMTWINTTDNMFSDPPKHSKPVSPFKINNDESFGLKQSRNGLYHNYDQTKFIHKEMVYIPFQHIIKGQLLPQIGQYCFGINQLLLDSIDLLPHLIELRLLYFIQASDILITFLPSIIDILSTPGWGKQGRISDILQTSMQDSMYQNKLPFDRINVKWNTRIKKKDQEQKINNNNNNNNDDDVHLGSVISQISKLYFDLYVEWPLNIVIKPSVIDAYNRIFKFLLQLKASKLILERIDVDIRAKYKLNNNIYNDDVIHKYLAFRYKLYLFVNIFHNYCALQIDTKKWDELIQDVMNNCIGLDEICEKHNKFLQQTLQNLFLPQNEESSDAISSHIIHLLLCCDDTEKCWKKEMSEYLQFRQEIINIKQSSLFQHEKNKLWRLKENALKCISIMDVKFDRLYKFCLVTIDKIKSKSLNHNAINVVLHLDFNNFYSHFFQI